MAEIDLWRDTPGPGFQPLAGGLPRRSACSGGAGLTPSAGARAQQDLWPASGAGAAASEHLELEVQRIKDNRQQESP